MSEKTRMDRPIDERLKERRRMLYKERLECYLTIAVCEVLLQFVEDAATDEEVARVEQTISTSLNLNKRWGKG